MMATTEHDVPVHFLGSRRNPDGPGTLGDFLFAGHRFPSRCHDGWTLTVGPLELTGVDYWTAEAAVRAYVAAHDPEAVAEHIREVERFRQIVADVAARHEAAKAEMRAHADQALAARKRAAAAYTKADLEVDGDRFIDYVHAWSVEAFRCWDYCAKAHAREQPDIVAYWAGQAERAAGKCTEALARIGLGLPAD
jgi:hypothetical protein